MPPKVRKGKSKVNLTDLSPQELELFKAVEKLQEGGTQAEILNQLPEYETEELVDTFNSLLKKGLLALGRKGTQTVFSAVQPDEASKVKSLDQDEKLVYDHIKASGNEGLWIKTLKAKTNLHQGVVQKCVKSLEQRGHIKSIKSVKYPTRKMYMLAELTPSVDITGGPWFTEQEFDVDFIEQIAKQCHRYIISQSIPRHDPSAIYPPNYSKYPTATKVHTFIKDAKISTVELSIEDITLVLDTLAYDGKVQKIRKSVSLAYNSSSEEMEDEDERDDYQSGGSDVWCYKAVRDSSVLNYWHEVPCGRCPVLSFCSEGGPVNPRNCEYYKKWLYDF